MFDEPSIGLHPLDVQTLLKIIARLRDKGATILIITHDLDLMLNADYLIDMAGVVQLVVKLLPLVTHLR